MRESAAELLAYGTKVQFRSPRLSGIDPVVKLRRRIAVIDDDPSVRKALARLLRASDLDADAYGSAEQFLESLQTSAPDCLVLDLQMPEMNGLALQRELIRTGIRLPVVIITGHDEPEMEGRCLGAGAGAYLRKPLDDKTLLAAIENAINASGASDSGRGEP